MSANRQQTDKPKRKAPKTAFKKGVSGNASGRPKRTPEEFALVQACKDKTPAALKVIESIMNNGENERNRLAAAQSIIERGYGKPLQPLEHSGDANNPLQVIQRIELVAPANNSKD